MRQAREEGHQEPLYIQISDDLRRRVLMGEWATGEKIPTEMEFCDAYHVSRITVRGAIDRLVHEGLVERHRARGTFVRGLEATRETPYNTRISVNATVRCESEGGSHTLWADVSCRPADQRDALQLRVSPGEPIMVLRRARGVDVDPFAIFETRFTSCVEWPQDNEAYYGSFNSMLEERDLLPDCARESIEAMLPPAEIQQALHIGRGDPVLHRERMAWQEHGPYREYSECYYIGDLYKYYLGIS